MESSEMKLLDNSETEGYANCRYYELSEIGGVWLIKEKEKLRMNT